MITRPIAPLVSAGLLLGAGLGGFADGILFHQILQLHNMLSGRIPVADLVSAKVNMLWDGLFHAAVWILTLLGLAQLFRAGERADAPWSRRLLAGSMLAGWGLFNTVEGILDHMIFGLHHVHEYVLNHWPADTAFLASGLVMLGVGAGLIRGERRKSMPVRGAIRKLAYLGGDAPP
jgi:uncharacterized membrane protein